MTRPPPRKTSSTGSRHAKRGSPSAARARPARTPDTRHAPEHDAPRAASRLEIKYHGANACLALWRHRPADVIRIYVAHSRLAHFGEMLKWAAAQRKAYHVVESDDLERLTETTHHGGICVLAREPEETTFAEMREALRAAGTPQQLLYLDGVENPHNLGAILRAAAHFGVKYILGAGGELPRISPSVCRVAEGAAEHVRIVRLPRGLAELKQLRDDGFKLIGTHVRRGRDAYEFRFPARCVLVLGAEEQGMSERLHDAVDATVCIPGAGNVDSLNVASACAVLVGEYFRQSTESTAPR